LTPASCLAEHEGHGAERGVVAGADEGSAGGRDADHTVSAVTTSVPLPQHSTTRYLGRFYHFK